jgi:hypothetical protein
LKKISRLPETILFSDGSIDVGLEQSHGLEKNKTLHEIRGRALSGAKKNFPSGSEARKNYENATAEHT